LRVCLVVSAFRFLRLAFRLGRTAPPNRSLFRDGQYCKWYDRLAANHQFDGMPRVGSRLTG
ncbi:hypothetical protein BHE74_00059356, partial [Ensete ventricosum]